MPLQNLAERPIYTEPDFFVPRTVDFSQFSRTDIIDLLNGTVAAVGIRHFLPATLCMQAMARLSADDFELDTYDRKGSTRPSPASGR